MFCLVQKLLRNLMDSQKVKTEDKRHAGLDQASSIFSKLCIQPFAGMTEVRAFTSPSKYSCCCMKIYAILMFWMVDQTQIVDEIWSFFFHSDGFFLHPIIQFENQRKNQRFRLFLWIQLPILFGLKTLPKTNSPKTPYKLHILKKKKTRNIWKYVW